MDLFRMIALTLFQRAGLLIAPKGLLYKRALISLFVRCLSVSSVSGQNPILPKGICARDMLGPSGSFLKMSLLDPSWTKNEPLNPHTQELKLLIGGSFSGEKTQIGTRKSAHSGTKTVDWRIILLSKK